MTLLSETAGTGAASGMTMETILSLITQVMTAAVGWIGIIIEVIVSNPIFLIGIVITFIGIGIGLVSRLLHL